MAPDGSDMVQAKKDVMEAVRGHFRPEFLNRLDETIIFDRLNRENMDGIVTIQMARLLKRLAARKIELSLARTSTAIRTPRTFGART